MDAMKSRDLVAKLEELIFLYGNQPVVTATKSELTRENDMEGGCQSVICEFDQAGAACRFVIYGKAD